MKHKGNIDLEGNDIVDVGAIDASINVLNDVNTTEPTGGSFLRWDAGQGKWIDEQITGTDIDWDDTTGQTIEAKIDGIDINLTSLNQAVKQQGGFTTIYKVENDKTRGYMEVGDTSATLGKNNTTIALSENSPGIVDIKVQDDGVTPATVTAMRVTNAASASNTPQVIVGGTAAHSATTTLTVSGDSYVSGDLEVAGTVTGVSLAGLSDTNIAPAANDYLRYDGANWRAVGLTAFKNVAVSGQTTVAADTDMDTLTLAAGTNVTITTDAATDTITINSTASGGSSTLAGLTDTFIATPAIGEILKYDGSEWTNDNFTLNEAFDVNITSVSDGQVLTYDSATGKWVNETPAAGGGMSDLIDDLTPQLGGDLDTNGKYIDMTANSASTSLVGPNQYAFRFKSGGVVQNTGLYFNSVSGSYEFLNSSSTPVFGIKASTGETTVANAYTLPTADGTSGQVLSTDGAGNVDWSTPSGGGAANPFRVASYGGRQQHGTAQNGKAMIASGGTLGFNYYSWSQDFNSAVGGLGTPGTTTITGNAYKIGPSTFKATVAGDAVVRGTFLGDSDVTSGTWYIHVWKLDSTTVSNMSSGTYTSSSTGTLVASASVTNPTSLSNILPLSYESTNGVAVTAGDMLFATVEHSATVSATEYYVINLNIDIE